MIALTFNNILLYITINNYTIFHVALPTEIQILIGNIINVIALDDKTESWILLIINLVENLIILVFLEILEINICGCNYNTKRSVTLRSISEKQQLINNSSVEYEDESENDRHNNELKNLS